MISSIAEFKKTFADSYFPFIYISMCRCSIEVLEYYINNYDDIEWGNISRYQPLTSQFIEKYRNKIDWINLFQNKNTKLSHRFIVKYLYSFNLYEVYIRLTESDISITRNIALINRIIYMFPEKYKIDKISYEIIHNKTIYL